jgi:hypothetical protein
MAWGGPVEPAPRRESWKKEIRRGPWPEGERPDRLVATAFGTQAAFGTAFAVLILAATVFYAQYSGAVRWLLAIVVLAAGAYVVVRLVGMRARDPRPFRAEPRAERAATGDLRSLSTTLSRASAGLKYSQVMFAARMKDAFLEKVRVARGLPTDALDLARSDPERLLALIGDRDLVMFVLESERNHRNWPALLRHLPIRRGFTGEAGRILAKMEAWR